MKRFYEIADYLQKKKLIHRIRANFFVSNTITLSEDKDSLFELKTGMRVKLGDISYKVERIVKQNNKRYRVFVDKDITVHSSAWMLDFDYLTGTRADILNTQKSAPLIWLLYPLQEDFTESILYKTASPVFVFAATVDRNAGINEREQTVYDVLEPLKDLWLYTMQINRFNSFFEFNGKEQLINHTATAYYLYGNDSKEVFEFTTAAIELILNNLKLKI